MPRCTQFLIGSLLFLVVATPAAAVEVTFTTANDGVVDAERPDDLYTAESQLGIRVGGYRLELEERMFTDRRRQLRFDETVFEVARPLPAFREWQGEIGLGGLHVGRGLLGESAQNAVHRLIGSPELDLEYAVDHRLYPRARLDLWRPALSRDDLDLRQRATAVLAPGFDSHLRIGLEAERRLGPELIALAGVAVLGHHVETELLRDIVSERGVAWNVGLAWRDIVLGYSYNLYGTESGHVTLGYRVTDGPGGGSPRR